MVSFTQRNITNISPKFYLKWQNIAAIAPKYRFQAMRNIADISRGQSRNFVCITFAQYGLHPHPRPPAPSLAMADSLFLMHAKTMPLQNYQIQLLLRSVEPHCGLRENVISLVNSMDVLERPFTETPLGEKL